MFLIIVLAEAVSGLSFCFSAVADVVTTTAVATVSLAETMAVATIITAAVTG